CVASGSKEPHCELVPVYLHSILKNHTAHACEGDTLIIDCPSRTSVAVLSAFYGRRVPNQYLCPSANPNTTCLSPSALRKVSRRCHGRANCSVQADTLTFGDPCFPGTRKHLRVSFTCGEEIIFRNTGTGEIILT
uniref:Si:ch73-335m24.2 n=1 Tax=Echeneis naucrates TaxID=173247 RepID=A0A665UUW8_ECHNA